jgi:hypothetical protein
MLPGEEKIGLATLLTNLFLFSFHTHSLYLFIRNCQEVFSKRKNKSICFNADDEVNLELNLLIKMYSVNLVLKMDSVKTEQNMVRL